LGAVVSPWFFLRPTKEIIIMEKLLLIMALLGSAQLAFNGAVKVGKLIFAHTMPKPRLHGIVRRDVVRLPNTMSCDMKSQPEEPIQATEDWSKYDTPAFIRRCNSVPKLEPVQIPVKASKTGKRRRSKAKTVDTVSFEIVA
jgi:hypothetical protein